MRKFLLAIVGLLVIPAHAQVTQSAQINSNTLNTTANIVTLDTNATALSVAVSTTANLSCSTYPVITFIDTRNAVEYHTRHDHHHDRNLDMDRRSQFHRASGARPGFCQVDHLGDRLYERAAINGFSDLLAGRGPL